jgi:aquaporin Z
MKQFVMEFIGTFFLVLVIALSGNPLAIGFILMALVYAGGYISGAQYNPAVTLAVWMQGKFSGQKALKYVIAQLIAGGVAALTANSINTMRFSPSPGAGIPITTAFLVEALGTFILSSVVLHVAVSEKNKNNQFYGLAIGGTVLALAFSGGAISGGVFNPAVAVGPILINLYAKN